MVLSSRKDGSLLFREHYGKLNFVTMPDSYPRPRMDEYIDFHGKTPPFPAIDASTGCLLVGKR